jgi:hypothetical protein
VLPADIFRFGWTHLQMKTTQRQREDALLEKEGFRSATLSGGRDIWKHDALGYWERSDAIRRIVTHAASALCLPITKP